MKKISLLLFVTLVFGATLASATVCDFEAFTGAGVVPNGYCAINWNGEWSYYDGVQPPYTPHSGVERIYPTGNLASAEFDFQAPVVFDGAWWAGYSGQSGILTYDMFLGGNLVAQATLDSANLSDVPLFFASGYAGQVDAVVVVTAANFWIIDDVTYNGTTTPEPGTLGLLASGMLGAFGVARRRLQS